MTKNKTKVSKMIITDPKEAVSLLREYMKNTKPTGVYESPTVSGSKARWASTGQVAAYVKSKYRKTLDIGWFGRSLNAAISNKMNVSSANSYFADHSRTVYRNSR